MKFSLKSYTCKISPINAEFLRGVLQLHILSCISMVCYPRPDLIVFVKYLDCKTHYIRDKQKTVSPLGWCLPYLQTLVWHKQIALVSAELIAYFSSCYWICLFKELKIYFGAFFIGMAILFHYDLFSLSFDKKDVSKWSFHKKIQTNDCHLHLRQYVFTSL